MIPIGDDTYLAIYLGRYDNIIWRYGTYLDRVVMNIWYTQQRSDTMPTDNSHSSQSDFFTGSGFAKSSPIGLPTYLPFTRLVRASLILLTQLEVFFLMSALSNLDSILDFIDSRKRKLQEEESSSSSSSSSSNLKNEYIDPLASFYWTKYFDGASNNYYYHNRKTNITQWEVPEDYVEQSQLKVEGADNDKFLESTALFHSKRPGIRFRFTQ